VWAASAKLLRRLGRPGDALAALNTALDLNPPPGDAAAIRGALDRLAGGGDGDESDGEAM
jgi:predicted RNA polymerase sigma factor